MKAKIILLILAAAWANHPHGLLGQGAFFQNLNFEAAHVTGYAPGGLIPFDAAFPDWNATLAGPTPVFYDGLSVGGAMISICDSNTFPGGFFNPLQGRFTALLFGGWPGSPSIWQTGLVPAFTRSLRMEIGNWTTHFIVSLGGQVVNMTPLETFPNYTLYGADISFSAGQVATLSLTTFTQPGEIPPSFFVVDDIVFSPQPVPEPGAFALFSLGTLLALTVRWFNRRMISSG